MIADPKFAEIAPDFVFAWHNMPGLPFGRAALAAGTMNCASRGMRAILSGSASHASTPELGVSPLHAVAKLMPKLTALGRGGPLDAGYSLVTVTHVEMGERAFGVAPGGAEIWATLRALTDATMAALVEKAERIVRDTAQAENLRVEIVYQDVFAHCENAPAAVELIARALEAERVSLGRRRPADARLRGFWPLQRQGAFGDVPHRRGRAPCEPAQPRLRLSRRPHRHRLARDDADCARNFGLKRALRPWRVGPCPRAGRRVWRTSERFSIRHSRRRPPSPLMGEGWGGGENLLRFSVFPPP